MIWWEVVVLALLAAAQGYHGYQEHQGYQGQQGYQGHQHQGYQGYQRQPGHQDQSGYQEHQGYQRQPGYQGQQGYQVQPGYHSDASHYDRRGFVGMVPPGTSRYVQPTVYPCMEDWNKKCEQDSDCCSGTCLSTFCKVQGIEATNGPRRKRPRVIINISK